MGVLKPPKGGRLSEGGDDARVHPDEGREVWEWQQGWCYFRKEVCKDLIRFGLWKGCKRGFVVCSFIA